MPWHSCSCARLRAVLFLLISSCALGQAPRSAAQAAATDPNDNPTKTLSQPDSPYATYLKAHPGAVALPHNRGQLRFRTPDGKAAAILGPVTHQDPQSGAWAPNAPILSETKNGWRLDGSINNLIVRKNGKTQHVITQTYTDLAARRDSVLAITVPALTYDHDFGFHFNQDGLTWNLTLSQTAAFNMVSTVSKRLGAKQYTFAVSSSESLSTNSAGQLVGDSHVILTRAVMIPKLGKAVPCTAWSWSRKDGASFTCDDSALRDNQFPYRIDPSSQTLTDGGAYNIWTWHSTYSNDGGDQRADVDFNTSGLIPAGGSFLNQSCGFNVMDYSGDGGSVVCDMGTFSNTGPTHVSVRIDDGCGGDCDFSYSADVSNISLTVTWNAPSYPTSTIATAPAGLSLTVDGGACVSPCSYQWTPGSSHTIAATSPQSNGGTQFLFSNWSDGGALSHSITAASSATTYTAAFTTQYYLTTAVRPAGGTISPASGWYNAGSVAAISAAANSGYQFGGFSGALGGTSTPQNLTVNAPLSVTANFSPSGLPSGLFAWWPGENNTTDSITGAGATAVNGAAYAVGKIGQAFSFNGSNSYLQVGESGAVSGARTYAAWVYPVAANGQGMPVLVGGAPGSGDFFGVTGSYGGCSASGAYHLYVDHWNTACYIGNTALTPNTWSHVAVTWDGSTLQFYINGVAAQATW